MTPSTRELLACGLGLLLLFFAAWRAVYVPRRDQAWCQSNLWQLRGAAVLYASDYGCLPPRPTQGDWVGLWQKSPPAHHREGDHPGLGVIAEGPLLRYLLVDEAAFCPADRTHPYSSYSWNYAIAGQPLREFEKEALVWDRRPLHRRGRNVAFVARNTQMMQWPPPNHVLRWCAEQELEKLGR